MGEEGSANVISGIRQIVRLKEMLQKWHNLSSDKQKHPEQPALSSVKTDKPRTKRSKSPEPPPDVPEGYCPMYVGREKRRFVIPTLYLSLPAFKMMLQKAEEEYGFDHDGGALWIPCDIESFKYILRCMEQHVKSLVHDEGKSTL